MPHIAGCAMHGIGAYRNQNPASRSKPGSIDPVPNEPPANGLPPRARSEGVPFRTKGPVMEKESKPAAGMPFSGLIAIAMLAGGVLPGNAREPEPRLRKSCATNGSSCGRNGTAMPFSGCSYCVWTTRVPRQTAAMMANLGRADRDRRADAGLAGTRSCRLERCACHGDGGVVISRWQDMVGGGAPALRLHQHSGHHGAGESLG
jgi:hypothetical protein